VATLNGGVKHVAVEYRGEKFSGYNKPKRTPNGPKKFAVLAKKGDKVKLVRFGDPDMSIKKDQKANKKSYCARSSGIKGTDDKFSANYWSRKKWNC
jgi:hypothetical protein